MLLSGIGDAGIFNFPISCVDSSFRLESFQFEATTWEENKESDSPFTLCQFNSIDPTPRLWVVQVS